VCEHCAPVWNELGVVQRRQGRFTDAEQSYRKAIAADPGYALAYYNLAIFYEIYGQRPDLALDNYQHYLDLGADSASAPEVEKWVADLKRRVTASEKTARVEETP
jgi:tetratricopeptide (TPR) repeat protein